jgi:outer membrane protein assembly factor BamB
LALKAGGAGDITASGRLWTGQKGSNVSSPILHEGHLYWMNDQQGIAYCAKASTGEIVYEERIAGAGQVYASPVLAGGHIYYLSRTGKTFVVPAEPRFRLVATNNLQDGGGFNGSPAVADGRLFIRSDKHMYCIGTNK